MAEEQERARTSLVTSMSFWLTQSDGQLDGPLNFWHPGVRDTQLGLDVLALGRP